MEARVCALRPVNAPRVAAHARRRQYDDDATKDDVGDDAVVPIAAGSSPAASTSMVRLPFRAVHDAGPGRCRSVADGSGSSGTNRIPDDISEVDDHDDDDDDICPPRAGPAPSSRPTTPTTPRPLSSRSATPRRQESQDSAYESLHGSSLYGSSHHGSVAAATAAVATAVHSQPRRPDDIDDHARRRRRVEIHRGRVLRSRHLLGRSLADVQERRRRWQERNDAMMRAVSALLVAGTMEQRDQEDGRAATAMRRGPAGGGDRRGDVATTMAERAQVSPLSSERDIKSTPPTNHPGTQRSDDLNGLYSLYAQARTALDELGPAEAQFDALMLRLNREEDALEEEEEEFYGRSEQLISPVTDTAILDAPLSPLRESYVPENEQLRGLDLNHPLVANFLEVRGQVEETRERIGALEAKYTDLLEEAEFRHSHDMTLANDKTTFLEAFAALHTSAVKDLQAMEVDMARLARECRDLGLFDDWASDGRPSHDAAVEDMWEAIQQVLERSPLGAAAQQYPQHVLPRADVQSKREHVTQWMWEWCSTSVLQRLHIRHALEEECPDLVRSEVDEGGDDDERRGARPPVSSSSSSSSQSSPSSSSPSPSSRHRASQHLSVDPHLESWAHHVLAAWFRDEAGKDMTDEAPLSTMAAMLAESDGDGDDDGNGNGDGDVLSHATDFLVPEPERPMIGLRVV